VISIVRLTIGEALRRRVLWVLFAAAVLLSTLMPLGVARLASLAADVGANRQAFEALVAGGLIFVAFQTSFVLALSASFLGSSAISRDIESGAAGVLLSRPLLRSTYLIGRWLGLAIVLAVEAGVIASLPMVVSAVTTGYTPPSPILPVLFLAVQGVVVLAFAVTLSARFTSAIAGGMAMVAYTIAWLAGVIGSIAAGGTSSAASLIGLLTQILFPTDALWRGVLFGVEPPELMAIPGIAGTPFFVAAPPNPFMLAWSALWILLVLWQGIAFLRRRDL